MQVNNLATYNREKTNKRLLLVLPIQGISLLFWQVVIKQCNND